MRTDYCGKITYKIFNDVNKMQTVQDVKRTCKNNYESDYGNSREGRWI
jgi:hypothetical protein